MSIFDKDRIGRLVCCEVVHGDTGDKVTGYISWTQAKVGEIASRVSTSGAGQLSGPWTVVTVDVPIVTKYPVNN